MGRLALLALLIVAVTGCFHPEPPRQLAPLYRFADPTWRSKAETNSAPRAQAAADEVHTVTYPVMTLDDEVRYTLGQALRQEVFFSLARKIGADSSLQLGFPVSPPFQPGERVALETETTVDGERKRHPPIVGKVEMIYGKPGIAYELPLPAEYANRSIGLHVVGTILSKDTALYFRTPPVAVPRNAYLDFALGIEEAAWRQGPVEFRVQSCAGQECTTIFQEVVDPSIPSGRSWQPRRVELEAPPADREVSFSFESRLVSSKSDTFSLPIWANPTVYAPVTIQNARTNFILISVDTLSAKHLPTYGYEFATAPFLDGVLARDGTVFERAIAAATSTPQSHMSMFTSVQPCRHGVITGMEYVRPELVTLAEVLRAAGYETGAVTEDGWLAYEPGYGHGFNVYAENKSPNVMAPEGQFDATLAKARSWIVRNADKPFFLFLHTFQVHDPYTPPDQYKNLFRERNGAQVDENSPRYLREVVAYDQEIRYTDDLLKRFFEFLRERRYLDNTVIIVTSDHGEEFFEHGQWGHGRNLFDEVTHVPLILWGPGRVPQGTRSAQTVGHIDLMPTILTLAGVGLPSQATGRNILAPAAAGNTASSGFRFTESRVDVAFGADYERLEVLPPSFMVQQGSRKMSRYRERDGHRYEAYDVESDPREKNDRLPADAAAFEPLKRLIDDYEAACVVGVPQEEPPSKIELDAEHEEKLRALGYLE